MSCDDDNPPIHRSNPSLNPSDIAWDAALAKVDEGIGRVTSPLSLDHDGGLVVDSLDDQLVGSVDALARYVESLTISIDDEGVSDEVRERLRDVVDLVDLAVVRTEPLRRLRQLGFPQFDVLMTLEALGVEVTRATLEAAMFFDSSIEVIDELAMVGLVARRAALHEERWRLSQLGARVLDECRRQVDAVLHVCVSLIDAELSGMADGDQQLDDGFAVGAIGPEVRAEDQVTVLWFECLGAKAFQICETHAHSAWVKVAFGAQDAQIARYHACLTVAHLVGAQRPRYVEEMIEALRRLFTRASVHHRAGSEPEGLVTRLVDMCQRFLDELREGFAEDPAAFEDVDTDARGGRSDSGHEHRVEIEERRRQVEQAKAALEQELDASCLLKVA